MQTLAARTGLGYSLLGGQAEELDIPGEVLSHHLVLLELGEIEGTLTGVPAEKASTVRVSIDVTPLRSSTLIDWKAWACGEAVSPGRLLLVWDGSKDCRELREFCIPEIHAAYALCTGGRLAEPPIVHSSSHLLLASVPVGADADAVVAACTSSDLLTCLVKVETTASDAGGLAGECQKGASHHDPGPPFEMVVAGDGTMGARPAQKWVRAELLRAGVKPSGPGRACIQVPDGGPLIAGHLLARPARLGGALRRRSHAAGGPTSLPPLLAALTVRLARVARHSLAWDPCCGSGSLLHAALGTAGCRLALGSDAARGALPEAGAEPAGSDWAVLDAVGAARRAQRGRWLDALLADPPYGVRAVRHGGDGRPTGAAPGVDALRAAAGADAPLCQVDDQDASCLATSPKVRRDTGDCQAVAAAAETDDHLGPILRGLLDLARHTLVPGGRLALWLPRHAARAQDLAERGAACGLRLEWCLLEARAGGLGRALAVWVSGEGGGAGREDGVEGERGDAGGEGGAGGTPCRSAEGFARRTAPPGEHARRHDQREAQRAQRYAAVRGSASGLEVDVWRAAWLGDTAAIASFLAAGGDVDARDLRGQTALQFAAGYGRLPAVRLLLETGASLEAADEPGAKPALHRAAARGHVEVVRALLAAGASPAQRCGEGLTALMLAAQFGHSAATAALAADGGLLAEDPGGRTALDLAAQWGKEGTLRALLAAGPGTCVPHLARAVLLAARWGHVGALRTLAAAGADLGPGLREAEAWARPGTAEECRAWVRGVRLAEEGGMDLSQPQ
ncbi:hypothetical protein ACKKBG_A38290 [Auxenochlorella protothecoides x Auxenochlorella symbiontica]